MLPALSYSTGTSNQESFNMQLPVARVAEKDLIFLSHDDVLQRIRDSFYILIRFLSSPSCMNPGSKLLFDTFSGPNIEIDENLCLRGLEDLNEWCADPNCSTGIIFYCSLFILNFMDVRSSCNFTNFCADSLKMGGGAAILLALNFVNEAPTPSRGQPTPSQAASNVTPTSNSDAQSTRTENPQFVTIRLPTRIHLEGRLHVPAVVQARVCSVIATMCQNCRPVQRHLLSLNAHRPLLGVLEEKTTDHPDVQTLRLLLAALSALSCNLLLTYLLFRTDLTLATRKFTCS